MVSEDQLLALDKPKVQNAEEVSSKRKIKDASKSPGKKLKADFDSDSDSSTTSTSTLTTSSPSFDEIEEFEEFEEEYFQVLEVEKSAEVSDEFPGPIIAEMPAEQRGRQKAR
jgi:hypothetical protein